MPYVQTPETCGSSGISLDGPSVITGDGPRAGEGPRTTTGWTLEGPQGKCGKKLSSAPSAPGRGAQPQMGKAVPAHTSISALRDPGQRIQPPWAGLLTGSKVS